MTPEQQRIVIAEACGAKAFKHIESGLWSIVFPDGHYGPNPRGGISEEHAWRVCTPNYPTDLNACHEMEKFLTERQWDDYAIRINGMVNYNVCQHTRQVIQLTAPQRCEAFLRTIGKWVEEEKE